MIKNLQGFSFVTAYLHAFILRLCLKQYSGDVGLEWGWSGVEWLFYDRHLPLTRPVKSIQEKMKPNYILVNEISYSELGSTGLIQKTYILYWKENQKSSLMMNSSGRLGGDGIVGKGCRGGGENKVGQETLHINVSVYEMSSHVDPALHEWQIFQVKTWLILSVVLFGRK